MTCRIFQTKSEPEALNLAFSVVLPSSDTNCTSLPRVTVICVYRPAGTEVLDKK